MQKLATRGAGGVEVDIAGDPTRFLGPLSCRRVHNGDMKVKRTAVSAEEKALFLDAVRGAQPLATRDRVAVPHPPASPVRVAVLPPEIKLAVEGDCSRYSARAPEMQVE